MACGLLSSASVRVASVCALLLVAACGSAEIGDSPATVGTGVDGGSFDLPDAEPLEDGITLRQAQSDTISSGNSIACVTTDAEGAQIEHKDDAFYRVFDLGALGLRDGFVVESVRVGIESASSPTGSQPGNVRLYTLSGGFTLANLDRLASVDVTIENQNAQFLEVPITANVPGNAKLVVEFSVPDSAGGKQFFWIGSNANGQTGPSFWRSTACGQPEPGDLGALGQPDMHVVLSVRGTRP